MSDLPPLPDTPPPMHPAPPQQWKPLSGLAVTAFALSLILIIVALMGFWLSEALPLVLGIIALITLKSGEKRGRKLAVWAIVIAFGVGSCTCYMHSGTRRILADTAESVMSILSSKVADEEKEKSLRGWAWAKALEKDPALPRTWIDRYAGVVTEFGAWKESFELPSLVKGFTPMLMTPDDIVEIGTDDTVPPAWPPWAAFWVEAPFEKGVVHVAVVFKGGDKDAATSVTELQPGKESAVIGDVRFYRLRSAKAEDGP